MTVTLDKTAGASGEYAPMWETFTDAALDLLRGGDDAYALIYQVVQAIEWYAENEA